MTIETANCCLDEAYVAALADGRSRSYVMIAEADTGAATWPRIECSCPNSSVTPQPGKLFNQRLMSAIMYGFGR
jgi:hypothetical protein